MDIDRVELGDTYRLLWRLTESDGGPATGETPITGVKRESDGLLYDFDSDAFSADPTVDYSEMTEDDDFQGVYYLDFDTSVFVEEDDLLFYSRVSGDVSERLLTKVSVVRPAGYAVSVSAAFDYDNEIITVAACAVGPSGVVGDSDAEMCTFTVFDVDGSEVLGPEQVSDSTSGVFKHSEAMSSLESHSAYTLVAGIEVGAFTYYGAWPITTL